MKHKILEKNGRKFVASAEDSRTVFIGTVGVFSTIATQMVCHDAMEPLHWKPTGTLTYLVLDGKTCIAVGYKIPLMKRLLYRNTLDYLESVF